MKKGKRVLSIFIVSLLLISSVSLVSAGLKDWFVFGDSSNYLEGELSDNSFNIGISMTNQAPTIESWNVPVGSPTACTTTSLPTFIVNMYDPDGEGDLITGGIVTVQFSNGGVNRPAAAVSCSAGVAGGDPDRVTFTCPSITMNFYDDGSAGDPWTVTVIASDGTDPATNSPRISVAVGDANFPHFVYGSNKIPQLRDDNDPVDFSGGDDTLTWDNIATTSTNKVAGRYLIGRNCGNEVIPSIAIIGDNLESDTTSTPIEPDSFSVAQGDPTPCDGGEIINQIVGVDPVASSSIVVGSAPPDKEFHFCLEQINPDGTPSPIDVGEYDSTLPASAWTLIWN